MVETQTDQNIAPQGGPSADQEMQPYDIIKKDIEIFNLKLNPNNVYAAILEMVKQPNHRVVRANNTLLVIDNLGHGIANAVIFTADGFQTFVESIQQLAAGMKAGGFKKVTIPSSGTIIEKLLKRSGLKYKIRNVKENGQNGHKITVDLT
jgi:hypothetical protein